MVIWEKIETGSTVTSIIPASTVNSNHNSTVLVTQNNQPEPISSELINLHISNTLHKAKTLANITEEQGSVDDFQINKLCHSEADNTALTSNRADTATTASVDIYKASKKAHNNALQHKEYQIPADLWKNRMNSYPTVRKLLGHPNTCKLLNGWHPLMEKNKMMVFTEEWREKNSPPSKKVASNSDSNVKKQPQAQNKGKGKAPATKPHTQSYRIPKIQQDTMKNVFQMARTMREVQKKEEARSKYEKWFLIFFILCQNCMKLKLT
ncbi:hypothetical protein O181_107564 [Austropuccinia psidii MF-1]|uniref:Uncharacterized protein n=1 Tax=Austropuccinia psidii MF-1 TaxID=1389203 RepID=A0A9Q3JUB4_9BASI|nr:hypothetical protein [Austropuccinia psidii MF-1]